MSSANFKPKRTAAASRGFLATARLSCYKSEKKHVFYVFYLQINVFNICASQPTREYTPCFARHWTSYSGQVTWNWYYLYSLHFSIRKQNAYANKSTSILIVAAQVARHERSGVIHILFYSRVLSCRRSFVGQLSADDRNTIGAISRKALRRGVTHTAFDIEEIIDSADRKLFTRITQPGHCLNHLLPPKTCATLSPEKTTFLPSTSSHRVFTVQKQFYQ